MEDDSSESYEPDSELDSQDSVTLVITDIENISRTETVC